MMYVNISNLDNWNGKKSFHVSEKRKDLFLFISFLIRLVFIFFSSLDAIRELKNFYEFIASKKIYFLNFEMTSKAN